MSLTKLEQALVDARAARIRVQESGRCDAPRELWRQYQRAQRDMWALQDQARDELAQQHEWRVAKTEFTTGALARRGLPGYGERYRDGVIDHPTYFWEPTRPYRPAAILSQPYGHVDQEYLDEHQHPLLNYEFLDAVSWYNPGGTVTLLITPARPAPISMAEYDRLMAGGGQ